MSVQTAERIYHYGNNTTMSNIWPMFSAEDSLDVNDTTIYLGRWLQGTGTWPQQHYITEAQNIFRDQLLVYNIITANDFPGWHNSNIIEGYAFFKYGLATLDTLRIQDRAPNFYTRPACFSARYANPNLLHEAETANHTNHVTSFLEPDEIYFVYSYLGQDFGKLNYNQILALPKGSYILKSETSFSRIIFNNFQRR
ncbi:MAG: hypothetical protein IPK10_01240 [Bacteroidetes bacterium]|nr:hypothetical protein [Bacteroidota bacterium]MBK7964067.1 hypothetical protein [Bacteroidota bacterium]